MAFDFSSVVIGSPDASKVKRRGGGRGGRDSAFLNGFRNILKDVDVGQGLIEVDPFEIIGLDIDDHETDENGEVYIVDSKGKRVTNQIAVNRIRAKLHRKGALSFNVSIQSNTDGTVNILRGEDITTDDGED